MVSVGSKFWVKHDSPLRFDTTHYALMDITQDGTLWNGEMTTWELNPYAMVEKARQLPEVEEATIAYDYCIPGCINNRFYIDSLNNIKECNIKECSFITGTRFCETVGMKPVEGSPSFDEMEATEVESPCIVSRSAAMRIFGTTDVVGHYLREYGNGQYTVVGVVEDVAMNLSDDRTDMVYIPTKDINYLFKLLLRLKDYCDVEQFCER